MKNIDIKNSHKTSKNLSSENCLLSIYVKMSKNVTSTSKKAVSFDYLKGREAVKIYLDSSNLARKDL